MKINQDQNRIISVGTEGLYLEYDPDDTWVAITDSDNTVCDEIGRVMLNVDAIDQLIIELKHVQQSMGLRKELHKPTPENLLISSVASGIAAKILERRLKRGETIEIPHLGIVIGQEDSVPDDQE
jgi:hypothetical protein